jgi:hypothetical protein
MGIDQTASEVAPLDPMINKSAIIMQSPHQEPLVVDKAHYAKLALLCVENAVHMGGRTVLNLTPPGKPRHDIAMILMERKKKKKILPSQSIRRTQSSGSSLTRVASVSSITGELSVFEKVMDDATLQEYDRKEDKYLLNPDDGVDSDDNLQEDPSSGDEDALDGQGYSDGEQEDDFVQEPLYSITDASGSATSGKIAFNYRKLKWFDAITAKDRADARAYLRDELQTLRKKDALTLTKQLKKIQRREKRKLEIEKMRKKGIHKHLDTSSDTDDDDAEEHILLTGMNKLPVNMTPSLSAALVIESLSLNTVESLEGMSKCYEGIVAAGSALIKDSAVDKKPTKQDIIGALKPLLITTLAEAAGESILALARLRKMCGTRRYQRRFVQRIAPSLVRPANAAQWCLRHQNDMESILSAVELILDYSEDIFRSGWFERGRTILADSKRAETLKAAAIQLKNLNTSHPETLMSPFTTGAHRRGRSLISGPITNVQDMQRDDLAEWEILAVDRQIRDSIKSLFQSDWSRINLTNAPPRDGESVHHHKKNGGISSRKKHSSSSSAASDADSVAGSIDNSIHSPPRLTKQQPVYANGTNHVQAEGRKQQTPLSPHATESKELSSRKVSKGALSEESPPSTPKNTSHEAYNYVSPSRTPVPEGSSPGSFSRGLSPRYYVEGSGAPIQPIMSPSSSPAPPISPKKNFRRNDGSSRMTNGSPGNFSAAQATYLRTLTSTAAERKRTVAACRALRAQITRFEDAFIKVHGRPPKGATERAPLQSTYSQYREWKRAIRADAASRIQAMYRGARIRMILIQDPLFTRIVENHAGRPPQIENLPQMPESILGSDNSRHRSSLSTQPLVPVPRKSGSSYDDNVELVMMSDQRPSWSKQRSGTDQSLAYSQASDSVSVMSNPFSPRGDTSNLTNVSQEFYNLSMAELQAAKRELKQRLKKYDMDFFKANGRMPVKAEKEPIRALYEQYNRLKNQISAVERDPSLDQSQKQHWKEPSTPSSINSDFSGSYNNSDPSTPSQTVHAPRPNRNRRPETPPNIPSVSTRQDLSALKTEKQHLHQMLRSYEKDFFRMHNRQVSSYADIRPVASQYRRYKEIKRKIMEFQSQATGDNSIIM